MESLLKTDTAGAPIHDVDFQKTIDESKATIQNEKQKEVKKGRGRPRKSGDPGPAISPASPSPHAPGLSPQPTDLSPYIAVPLQALSGIPAKKHGIAELALTPEEAKACAEALNQAFNVFVPNINQMSPKTAAVMGVFMVFGSIGFTKYQIYSEVQAARALARKPEEPGHDKAAVPQSEIELKPGQVAAQDYFKR